MKIPEKSILYSDKMPKSPTQSTLHEYGNLMGF